MLAAKRQQRKRAESTCSGTAGDAVEEEADWDNLAIYPLAILLLAGPSAIMSVIVVNAGFAGALASTMTGYAALLAVMVATGIILCLTVIAEGWRGLDEGEDHHGVLAHHRHHPCRAVGAICHRRTGRHRADYAAIAHRRTIG